MINDDELVVVSFVKMLPFPPQVWSAWVWWVRHLERQVLVKRKKEQDPVSTMQKTGWTNHSAFQSRHSSSLVWFGPVWCGLTVGVDHLDAVTNHLLVYLAILVWWVGNRQKTRWTKCNPALDRWPVRRQSFAMMYETKLRLIRLKLNRFA